jgi:hypothetical protein
MPLIAHTSSAERLARAEALDVIDVGLGRWAEAYDDNVSILGSDRARFPGG